MAILDGPPSVISGSILHSAGHVAVNGGSFVGVQNNVAVTNMHRESDGLDSLHNEVAPNAILNAGGRADPVKCYPGTREEVLELIQNWIDGKDGKMHRMMWLSGPAGAGKSAIMQSIGERCKEDNFQSANFFFFRADGSRNHCRPLVATLLYQLFDFFPEAKGSVADIIERKPLIWKASAEEQFTHLVYSPLRTILQSSSTKRAFRPILLLIDGLDECAPHDKQSQQQLLLLLHKCATQDDSPFLILVASRNEALITMTFNGFGSSVARIHLNENYRPARDIRRLVLGEFDRIKMSHILGHTLEPCWPPETSIDAIVQKSSGQFIYAATVMRFVANSSASPVLSLEKVLCLQPLPMISPFSQLDAVYAYIISQVEDQEATKNIFAAKFLQEKMTTVKLAPWADPGYRDSFKWGVCNDFTVLLSSYNPRYTYAVIDSCISDLVSIVGLRAGPDLENYLVFHHASLADFLLDGSRSGTYYVDVNTFSAEFASILFRKIRDEGSWETSLAVLSAVEAPTPQLTNALYNPPNIELAGSFAHLAFESLLLNIKRLYFDYNIDVYKSILRKWIFWGSAHNILPTAWILDHIPYANRYAYISLALHWRRLSLISRRLCRAQVHTIRKYIRIYLHV